MARSINAGCQHAVGENPALQRERIRRGVRRRSPARSRGPKPSVPIMPGIATVLAFPGLCHESAPPTSSRSYRSPPAMVKVSSAARVPRTVTRGSPSLLTESGDLDAWECRYRRFRSLAVVENRDGATADFRVLGSKLHDHVTAFDHRQPPRRRSRARILPGVQ